MITSTNRSAARQRNFPALFRKHVVWRWSDFWFGQHGLYCARISSANQGLFAELSGIISLLNVCARRSLKPYLLVSGQTYLDPARGDNVLDYYFDGPTFSASERRLIARLPVRTVANCTHLPGWSRHDYPNLDSAAVLFGRYFKVKSELAEEVEAFVQRHFEPNRTLGVHFRATDKWSEASRCEFEHSADFVRRCLDRFPALDRIFVATDSKPYLDFVRRRFPGIPVHFRAAANRSENSDPVHLSKTANGYINGKDAMLDSLLLARCAVLLKTMSNLSGWSKVFNPSLPVFLMNRPDGRGVEWLGFPEREMVQQGWFADTLLGDANDRVIQS